MQEARLDARKQLRPSNAQEGSPGRHVGGAEGGGGAQRRAGTWAHKGGDVRNRACVCALFDRGKSRDGGSGV